MPFDERVHVALRALERPMAEFRTTIEGALAQTEGYLATLERDPVARAERVRHELGKFAAGRIDAEGFSTLFATPAAAQLTHHDRFKAAIETLHDVLDRGEGLFVTQVAPGGSLAKAVEDALSRIGRAFGAVLAVELLRGGAYVPEQHDALLYHFAFRAWTKTERRYAPPLVVMVQGSDLHVGGLADFTDGRERIVLVVQGACPPASLVRLVTPGTLVVQTNDAVGLEQLANYDGPSIAAIVPAGAARFIHDPRAGREPWQRMAIREMPEPPKHAIGGISAWQMSEDLRQLAALSSAPSSGSRPTSGSSATVQDPLAIERLAAWLLSQSDVQGIG